MAAPVEGFVRLADDSAFTGKKIRAQSRVVGVNTVYERLVFFDRKASVLGIYEANPGQQTISATAQDGISTGFAWLHVPLAVSGCSARIRRVLVTSQHGTLLATPTAPRVLMSRFTFTGTATGTTVKPDPDTTYRTAKADLRTTVTGLTVTMVAALVSSPIVGALSAISAYGPHAIDKHAMPWSSENISPREDEWTVIAPGEGVVFWQDVAGTASDTRKVNLQIVWDEIDTA